MWSIVTCDREKERDAYDSLYTQAQGFHSGGSYRYIYHSFNLEILVSARHVMHALPIRANNSHYPGIADLSWPHHAIVQTTCSMHESRAQQGLLQDLVKGSNDQ